MLHLDGTVLLVIATEAVLQATMDLARCSTAHTYIQIIISASTWPFDALFYIILFLFVPTCMVAVAILPEAAVRENSNTTYCTVLPSYHGSCSKLHYGSSGSLLCWLSFMYRLYFTIFRVCACTS